MLIRRLSNLSIYQLPGSEVLYRDIYNNLNINDHDSVTYEFVRIIDAEHLVSGMIEFGRPVLIKPLTL